MGKQDLESRRVSGETPFTIQASFHPSTLVFIPHSEQHEFRQFKTSSLNFAKSVQRLKEKIGSMLSVIIIKRVFRKSKRQVLVHQSKVFKISFLCLWLMWYYTTIWITNNILIINFILLILNYFDPSKFSQNFKILIETTLFFLFPVFRESLTINSLFRFIQLLKFLWRTQ